MLTGALVPRRGTVAGVPGPRRSADECDAGWFAPVATRRRSIFSASLRYSVLRNSAIATFIIPRPMTGTIPTDSQSGTGQRGQRGAEDEEKEHGLDQRGDSPEPVGAEPDQLAPPDDAGRPQVVPEPVPGHGDPDLVG